MDNVHRKQLAGTIIVQQGDKLTLLKEQVLLKMEKVLFASTPQQRGGSISRIRPHLTTGSVVTTSKNDVDRIVTEYGVAELRGKSIAQRTRALINIAHPKFRDELTYEARRLGFFT